MEYLCTSQNGKEKGWLTVNSDATSEILHNIIDRVLQVLMLKRS